MPPKKICLSTTTPDSKRKRTARQAGCNVKQKTINPRKEGAAIDTQLFNESLYVKKQHILPNLDNGRKCDFCKALCWPGERPGFCCEKGKIAIDLLENYPNKLKDLLIRKIFIDHIRQYNNSLAMASIGIHEHSMPGFSPVVKLQGKIYHRIGSLLPNDDDHPKFVQIWFHDSDKLYNRLRHNPMLDAGILTELQNLLREINPYIYSLKSAIELTNSDNSIKMVIDARKRPSDEHIRRYNLPEASEVSVILPGEHMDHLNVLLHQHHGTLQAITELHRSYDPLHYVLMFPYGEGYKLNIPHRTGRGSVSPTEFARYRLQVRYDHFNQVLKCRRLTQQYACDQYVKAEIARLRGQRLNQRTIRAEK